MSKAPPVLPRTERISSDEPDVRYTTLIRIGSCLSTKNRDIEVVSFTIFDVSIISAEMVRCRNQRSFRPKRPAKADDRSIAEKSGIDSPENSEARTACCDILRGVRKKLKGMEKTLWGRLVSRPMSRENQA